MLHTQYKSVVNFLISNKKSIKTSFYLFSFIFFVILFLFNFPEFWFLMPYHIPFPRYPFYDMHGFLACFEGYANGQDVYSGLNLDIDSRPHISSSWGLFLGYLGVDRDLVLYISILCILIYVSTSVFIIFPKNLKEALLGFFVIMSPGAFLAIERANIDLVIFIGATVISIVVANGNLFGILLCLFLCYYLFLLKYYPLALFIIFTIRLYRIALFSVLFTILGVTLYLIYSDFEIFKIAHLIPKPTGFMTNGFSLIFETIPVVQDIDIFKNRLYRLFLILIVVMSVICFGIFKKDFIVLESSYKNVFFITGTGVTSFCFFLNTNYDYRLIFCVFSMPCILKLLKIASCKLLAICFIIFLLLGLWIEYIFIYFNFLIVKDKRFFDFLYLIHFFKNIFLFIIILLSIYISTLIFKFEYNKRPNWENGKVS